ncbi:Wound-induced polypeptide 1 [Hibiscus trionum]|uniref:Wound-induced polypeptide 1 n=1 Tax=Hibiscus trionum TaxID=183268 RepID=A0A9W7MSL3_HIBTR|nr:Wound-induced polypeptide 1 [Hibiscus trionum]
MSYLNRVWMATSVAVVQGRGENQGQNWKSGVKFLQRGQRRLFDGEPSDLRPISGAIGSDLSGMVGKREGQGDESIRRVMYLNCWGQG